MDHQFGKKVDVNRCFWNQNEVGLAARNAEGGVSAGGFRCGSDTPDARGCIQHGLRLSRCEIVDHVFKVERRACSRPAVRDFVPLPLRGPTPGPTAHSSSPERFRLKDGGNPFCDRLQEVQRFISADTNEPHDFDA